MSFYGYDYLNNQENNLVGKGRQFQQLRGVILMIKFYQRKLRKYSFLKEYKNLFYSATKSLP